MMNDEKHLHRRGYDDMGIEDDPNYPSGCYVLDSKVCSWAGVNPTVLSGCSGAFSFWYLVFAQR